MRGDFRTLFVVLARVLHFIASEIENQLPQPSITGAVTFTTSKGETMGEITVNEGDAPINATVSYVNAKTGEPASASDTPVWSSADDSIASVEASGDGMSATVTPVSSGDADGGTAVVISVVAHGGSRQNLRRDQERGFSGDFKADLRAVTNRLTISRKATSSNTGSFSLYEISIQGCSPHSGTACSPIGRLRRPSLVKSGMVMSPRRPGKL